MEGKVVGNEGPEKQVAELYAGAWTVEEKEYATALIQDFRDGVILGLKDKSTMRGFLAEKLGCLTKRISKKYEKSGYNGRLQYRSGSLSLTPEQVRMRQQRLKELEGRFLDSREAILQSRGNATPKRLFTGSAGVQESLFRLHLQGVSQGQGAAGRMANGIESGAISSGTGDLSNRFLTQAMLNQSMRRDIAAARAAALMTLQTEEAIFARDYLANAHGLGGEFGGATSLDLMALRTGQSPYAALYSGVGSSLGRSASFLGVSPALPSLAAMKLQRQVSAGSPLESEFAQPWKGGLAELLQRKRELSLQRGSSLAEDPPAAKRLRAPP